MWTIQYGGSSIQHLWYIDIKDKSLVEVIRVLGNIEASSGGQDKLTNEIKEVVVVEVIIIVVVVEVILEVFIASKKNNRSI